MPNIQGLVVVIMGASSWRTNNKSKLLVTQYNDTVQQEKLKG
ncbi:hypothetical protein [Bacillus mobilis]